MSRQSEVEAIAIERGRCLWVLDKIIEDLEADLRKKLLIESQRHLTETKLRIARSIVALARRGIVSGIIKPVELGHNDEDVHP